MVKGICPKCGYEFDRSKSLEGDTKPADGDISFCIRCGTAGIFKGGKVIIADEQNLPIKAINEIDRIRQAWKQIKEEMK